MHADLVCKPFECAVFQQTTFFQEQQHSDPIPIINPNKIGPPPRDLLEGRRKRGCELLKRASTTAKKKDDDDDGGCPTDGTNTPASSPLTSSSTSSPLESLFHAHKHVKPSDLAQVHPSPPSFELSPASSTLALLPHSLGSLRERHAELPPTLRDQGELLALAKPPVLSTSLPSSLDSATSEAKLDY